MKEGPDIAALAQLIGDPARANMLTALMSGRALTATELAFEAGVTPQTASSHLAKLEGGGLVVARKQGRHRYVTLANSDVAETLEALMGFAAGQGRLRTRTGPRDPALRQARVCYRHLAGESGVRMYDSLTARGAFAVDGDGLTLSDTGRALISGLGVDVGTGCKEPLARACLDWSMRRSHLGGALGRALLARMFDLGWARQIENSRVVTFTDAGKAKFDRAFPV